MRSAARYDAYAARDKTDIELEVRRRRDIYDAVKAYVEFSVSAGMRDDPEAFARDRFPAEPEASRSAVSRRIAEIVRSLHEGNHIGYGISRSLFDRYRR